NILLPVRNHIACCVSPGSADVSVPVILIGVLHENVAFNAFQFLPGVVDCVQDKRSMNVLVFHLMLASLARAFADFGGRAL
ncbi:hypothetical protein, partial [Acinetobacter baumannii]|uniref:hypothetical protein n=1 Tax=Acinetobacter baumannii TaxID=470 RepID=UPI001C097C61